MKILVLNCGSSSIKYQLFNMNGESTVLAKGLVEKIGLPQGILTHKTEGHADFCLEQPIENHQTGINLIIEALTHPDHGVIKQVSEIEAVGHRVAHGGEKFNSSALVTPEVISDIEKCIELAPLHNPANLKGITSIEALLPGIPQVAAFDTSFHQTLPEHAYIYGIPYYYYEKYRIRKYGFHGTSHKYVANKACEELGWNIEEKKIVSCHLGNGASVAAIDHGKSVETSMGFTPVEGLLMGTRSGDLDLGVLLFLMEKENMCCSELNDLINKKSGMLGVTGVSSDMRDIAKAANEGNHRAELALKMFAYTVRKYIGAYIAVMNGIDLLIFTGGIGENDCDTRQRICENLDYLGIRFDPKLNDRLRGRDAFISTSDSPVKAMVVTTNEELVIANDTYTIVNK
ncbi:MAG TPA: acetate kinase [Bacteroidales bacterium]|nr:MAG: acetate kinase [Bacteroidetes bacterium GWE2_42_24]OFY25350.1 MAG: acetate kinase [Bacteroidetes bacterium GWF2_43_11]PKP26639.1 MAG: acetate kinase [Bacteroidetes bacterium HGW-Bacteroidetes-22]HAQ64311.1 acetate kinase [Bacteroidales bacterium]HBZ67631.1 acetate kinase [Bacteroidales bacterium]